MPNKIHSKNKGWKVALSGTGINLALGILYTWSMFKIAIENSVKTGGEGAFTWDMAQLNDPYSVCCLVFAFSMIIAGKCQDVLGPRITAFISGILVGLGFLLISQTTSYLIWVLGFGVIVGIGIGFGYSSATPPGLKWFPARKTGLIAGIIVAGFGLASVYIAPLSEFLLKTYGIQKSMMIFGIAFAGAVCGLSLMLVNPPKGYRPEEAAAGGAAGTAPQAPQNNVHYRDMLRMKSFWILWIIYFIGSGAGLMVIGSMAGMAKKSMGEQAFLAVAIMAIGNAGGRIAAGVASDKFGRAATLMAVLLFQGFLMILSIQMVNSQNISPVLIVLLATLIGFNYGANLSLFPSLTKDLYGLKSFGMNYGVLFTAWGVGGFVLSRLSQMLSAATGNFNTSFIISAVLLSIGALLTLKIEKTRTVAAPKPAIAPVDSMFHPELGLTMADGGEKIKDGKLAKEELPIQGKK